MDGGSSALRRVVKRHVPFAWRQWVRMQLYELRLQRRAIRAGVSPVSILRKKLLGDDDALVFKGVPVRTNDPPATQNVARDMWCHGEYDVPGFVPQAGWRVVDVGANVGLYAMHAASRGAHVVSYEPHPDAADCLAANSAKWGVDVRRAAVVGTGGGEPMKLYISDIRDTHHTLLGRDLQTGEAIEEAIEVATVGIGDVLAEPCDLLKLDCEGGEFDILTAGGPAIRNAARIIAEVHLHAGDPQDLLGTLEAAGFEAELRPNPHPGVPYVQITGARR